MRFGCHWFFMVSMVNPWDSIDIFTIYVYNCNKSMHFLLFDTKQRLMYDRQLRYLCLFRLRKAI